MGQVHTLDRELGLSKLRSMSSPTQDRSSTDATADSAHGAVSADPWALQEINSFFGSSEIGIWEDKGLALLPGGLMVIADPNESLDEQPQEVGWVAQGRMA